MSKSTASIGWHPTPWNLQLSTVCRSQMFVAVSAGDRSAEVDQVSSSHAVLSVLKLVSK